MVQLKSTSPFTASQSPSRDKIFCSLHTIGCSFQDFLAFAADHYAYGQLGMCATQKWKKKTPWRRKTSTVLLNWFQGRFWTGFATNFNLSKSVHDFVFKP